MAAMVYVLYQAILSPAVVYHSPNIRLHTSVALRENSLAKSFGCLSSAFLMHLVASEMKMSFKESSELLFTFVYRSHILLPVVGFSFSRSAKSEGEVCFDCPSSLKKINTGTFCRSLLFYQIFLLLSGCYQWKLLPHARCRSSLVLSLSLTSRNRHSQPE